MRNIFMFSGQGAQFFHMGRELFDHNSIFKESMYYLNDIIYQLSGRSILDYIYNKNKKRSDICDDIRYTHLAIFMVEYSLYVSLEEMKIKPDILLGSSLGEYIALVAAGVCREREMIELLIRQVEFLEQFAEKGEMLAILSSRKFFDEDQFVNSNSELAAINSDAGIVISGRVNNINRIKQYLKSRDIFFQSLPIKYPFHSSLINTIQNRYEHYLSARKFLSANIPVFSCFLVDIIHNIPNRHLWNVIRHPIQLQESIRKISQTEGNIYIDLSPGGGMATAVKYNIKSDINHKLYSIIPFYGVEQKSLEEIKKHL